MGLKIGEPAPEFMANTAKGVHVNMNLQPANSLTRDKRYSCLLFFYPRASTPGCTAEAKQFDELLDVYKEKMVLIAGVSNDAEPANSEFANECGLRFPLICDTSLAISVAYGAAPDDKAASCNRMAVLVDRAGNVAKVWENVDAKTFAATALKELPEALPPPEPYFPMGLTLRMSAEEIKWREGAGPPPDSVIPKDTGGAKVINPTRSNVKHPRMGA